METANASSSTLHFIMDQWPRMAPCLEEYSFGNLSSCQQHLCSVLPFELYDTSSDLDNLSSQTLCSWGPSVGTAYMGFSGDEGFTGHVRSPVLAWP